jgi:transcription-repair coupling factor (superfamily II helicase)
MSEELIRDSISYELARNGQVFFVHNRVQDIKEVQGMIQRVVPDAKVVVGHGQMEGDKLEQVMEDFVDHKYDVLLATTIIESGIDISNANTMIINNAQNFGLSDLHQLRGRVGRSNKKAFCYLLAPPTQHLPGDAKRRLQAIEQFSELGSGMNISMRDLDIRGAGNIFSGDQSGFMADVGFEMYNKILNEAIEELKETEFKHLADEEEKVQQAWVKEAVLETDLELLIPDEYVQSITERLALYKGLEDAKTEEDLQFYEMSLIDRFGAIPQQVENLIETVRLRWIAQEIGFEKLVLKSSKMICYFVANQESGYYQSPAFTRVLKYVQVNPRSGKMYEKNEGLRFSFVEVQSITQAKELLAPIIANSKETAT